MKITMSCPKCRETIPVNSEDYPGRKRPLCNQCHIVMHPAKMPEPPRYKAIPPTLSPEENPIEIAAAKSLAWVAWRKENPVDWKTVAASTAISLGATVLVAVLGLVGYHVTKPCPSCDWSSW